MLNEEHLKKALERFPQKCLLINILSKRVEQLNNGTSPVVNEDKNMSNLDIALKEIVEGKISIKKWERNIRKTKK